MTYVQFLQQVRARIAFEQDEFICKAARSVSPHYQGFAERLVKDVRAGLASSYVLESWLNRSGYPQIFARGDDYASNIGHLARLAWLDKLIEAENE